MNSRDRRMAVLALVLISGGFLATILVLMSAENPKAVVLAAGAYATGVIVLEALLVGITGALLGASAASGLAAAATAANAYSLYLVHLNAKPILSGAYTLGIFLAVTVLLAAARHRLAPGVIGIVALAVIPMISLVNYTKPPDPSEPSDRLEQFAAIRLKERPNIYIMSFDAMIPGSTARKFFGIERLDYEAKLTNLGATLHSNAFVADTPSIPSMDALMRLDDLKTFDAEGYFAGRRDSPVSALFRANGYWVETGSSIPFYFGATGSQVDAHHYVAKNFFADNSLCKFASGAVRNFGVFGFCQFDRFVETKSILDREAVIENPEAAYFDSFWHKSVLSRLGNVPRDQPRLLIYYYYYPIGHAPNDFQSFDAEELAAYAARFEIQSRKASEVIKDLAATIRKNDPNAILIVFGDHGTKISRTADWREHTEFFVQDRHIVLLATFDAGHGCANPPASESYLGDGYVTVGRHFASVIRCLAENPAALDRAVNFVDRFDFAEFLIQD